MKISGLIKIFLPLLLICATVAGLVSGIHLITKDSIAENEASLAAEREQTKLALIAEIYGADKVFSSDETIPDTVDDIRRAETGECCVTVTADGYQKDSIQLFVAFDANGSLLRVRVLASNETTGIGSKVSDTGWLSQFEGKSGTLTLGDGVDKVSGATLSSKGVVNGINIAREAAGFGGN